jgi:thiamine kinase-like enzyme
LTTPNTEAQTLGTHSARSESVNAGGAVPSIADLLDRVPSWVGRAVRWQRLEGGLSHHIYRVDVDDTPYVLRVLDPAVSAAGLGVPAAQEVANTVRAARTGVGPYVHEVLPDVPAIVIEFIPGRTLGRVDLQDPAVIRAVAAACRRLHGGAAFGNTFDIFGKRDELLDVCARHGLVLPDGYRDADPLVTDLRAALAAAPLPPVPCHNDLLAENFIASGSAAGGADTRAAGGVGEDGVGEDGVGEGAGAHAGQGVDGEVIRIVDYQLSGNNDPAFELGDIAAEADFDPDRVALLAEAYFGPSLTPALLARVRLYLLASNVTWTLWFTVHKGLLRSSAVSFDYEAEAAEKWGQARRDLTAPEFGRLLTEVRR